MAALRAENPTTDNVISFPVRPGEKLSPHVPDANPSGTKESAENSNLPNSLNSSLSPIVPTSPTKHTSIPKARQHDEQYSLEEIVDLVARLTDKQLKSHFPKAWSIYHTLKRKTRSKSARETLHPGFQTFRSFLVTMGPAPNPDVTVDKIENTDPVYGPRECRWATSKKQGNNRSTNQHINWMGLRRTLAEWAELSGIKYETLKKRHQRAWPVERIFHDATVKKYRTPIAPPSPVAVSAEVAAPSLSLDADGWPVTLKESRDFETGWIHARAQAIKTGGEPLSKAFFGAWIIGSQLRALQRKLTAAGFIDLISGRDKLPPDEITRLTKLAREMGLDVAHYDYLLSINDAFLAAYLDEAERHARRSPYIVDPVRHCGSAYASLRALIKDKPQAKPLDVWKVYR